MTDLRGRTFADLVAGLNAGQHLTVDAVVAYVDGELGAGAHDRAAAHLDSCQMCSAEVAAQRQARSVVRSAGCPQLPAGLMAALCEIPQTADLPGVPDGLAVSGDGTVVTVTGPNTTSMARLGTASPLGTGHRLGAGPSILGRRIGRTGASAVVSGLVLGALIMSMFEDPVTDSDSATPQPEELRSPTSAVPSTASPAAREILAVPAADPDAGPADEAALLRGNTQPGWHAVHLPW